jgi:drug/metabolite transporter (DMT)-like permease
MIGLGFVATLSVLGTGLAMMLHYRLMSISNPLFASTVTLLMPVVAVIWGVIDGESFTFSSCWCGDYFRRINFS